MPTQKEQRKRDQKYRIPHRTHYADEVDRSIQAFVGKFTGGLSPASLALAFFDWYFHLRIHPAKQMELQENYEENFLEFIKLFMCDLFGGKSDNLCIMKSPHDKRFANNAWLSFPYDLIYQSFLMNQNWWHIAAVDVRGVSAHHTQVVDFTLRQILDTFSPSNSPLTNPEVQIATIQESGQNFVRGFENYVDDVRRYIMNEPPAGSENFQIGKNIAITPGKVIYRNRLIELIQYAPKTSEVYAEPVLITPAWIMKYYILDLTPKHSLVNYLVKQGHTVFMISWKNPTKEDSQLGMDDYLNLGILSALDVINKIIPQQKVQLVGYCLGGTLAAIAAATLARDNQDRLQSVTMLAAQTDFTDPGELGLFIDESQISFLESMMSEKGYLDTHQMAGAFQLLRSNDLIWSRMIREYLLGKRKPLTDLMFWNADATRLPYRMHSEYLRELFLNNELATGKLKVHDLPIALTDITVPIFAVATERDHVSPWKSVFKINLLTLVDVTFVLTTGGHNVGIVSLPVKNTKRQYRMSTLSEKHRYIDASTWYKKIKPKGGSWWPAFETWLAQHASGKTIPPSMGNVDAGLPPLENAPGTYVLQK